jgi:hypothetical protein
MVVKNSRAEYQAASSMVDPLGHLLSTIATSGNWLHYVCKHYLCDVAIVFVLYMGHAPFCVRAAVK